MIGPQCALHCSQTATNLKLGISVREGFCRNQSFSASVCSFASDDDEKREFSGHCGCDATVMFDAVENTSQCIFSAHTTNYHEEHCPHVKMQYPAFCNDGLAVVRPQTTESLTTATVNPFESMPFFSSPLPPSSPRFSLPSRGEREQIVEHSSHIVESISGRDCDNSFSVSSGRPAQVTFLFVNPTASDSTTVSLFHSRPLASSPGVGDQSPRGESSSQYVSALSMLEDRGFYGAWKVAALRRKAAHLRHRAHKRALEIIHQRYGRPIVDN